MHLILSTSSIILDFYLKMMFVKVNPEYLCSSEFFVLPIGTKITRNGTVFLPNNIMLLRDITDIACGSSKTNLELYKEYNDEFTTELPLGSKLECQTADYAIILPNNTTINQNGSFSTNVVNLNINSYLLPNNSKISWYGDIELQIKQQRLKLLRPYISINNTCNIKKFICDINDNDIIYLSIKVPINCVYDGINIWKQYLHLREKYPQISINFIECAY